MSLTRGSFCLSQVGGRFRRFRFSSQEAQSEEEKEKQEPRQVRLNLIKNRKVLTNSSLTTVCPLSQWLRESLPITPTREEEIQEEEEEMVFH